MSWVQHERVLTLLVCETGNCLVLLYCIDMYIIGERSEPPSDKLGGGKKICITRALVCLSPYGHVRPDNHYHANSHCVCTLTLNPDVAQ